MTQMLQSILLTGFILGYTLASAQSDYVVTIKSDTLYGKIKHLNFGKEQSVQLTPATGKKQTFTIRQTRGFSLEGQLFHPVRTVDGYVYMKLLKAGYLSLYAAQMPNQTGWDGRYLVKRDGTSLEVPNLGFKKNINRFLSNCEYLEAKIDDGVFNRNNIEALVDEYNTCIASKSNQPAVTPTVVPQTQSISSAWAQLEKEVNSLSNFAQKNDVLDMIREIQTKLGRGEKIPGFLLNGLKDSLKDQSTITATLDKALNELQ